MIDLAREAARDAGNAPALVTRRRTWSWAEVDEAVEVEARRQRARGYVPGDRLVLYGPNSVEAAVAILAGWRNQLVVAPISRRLPEAARVERQRGLAGRGPAGISTLLWTSGSSGRPKAVAHGLAAHIASARGSAANLPFGPGDRWLWSLDHHHVGGLAILVRAAVGRGAVVIPPAGVPVHELVPQCSHVSLVATQLHRALVAGVSPHRLRGALIGGGPVPYDLARRALDAGWPVLTTYGSTEAGSQVTATRPGDPPEALATAGHVLAGRALRLARDGEILIRGETMMRGYLVGKGLDPATEDGWFRTGDAGTLDHAGRLVVRGRIDHAFISGGEKIHPEEIERILRGHPEVGAAVVVGVPDPEWGARPVAFVQAAPEVDLRGWLAERLPGFMVPDRFEPWPALASDAKPDRTWFERLARRR